MSNASRSKRIARCEDRSSSRSQGGSRRDQRRLAIEPLAARLVLSAGSQIDLPEVDPMISALVAEQHAGPRSPVVASIGTGGHSSPREYAGNRGGGPDISIAPHARPGRAGSAGSRHGIAGVRSATVASRPVVAVRLAAVSYAPRAPIGLVIFVTRTPATPAVEAPAVAMAMATAMRTMSAEMEPAEIVASMIGSGFDTLNATQDAAAPIGVFATPATPVTPDSTDEDKRTPETLRTPDSASPADTPNDGGLIELESPQTRRGGSLPAEVVDDAWQSTEPLDFDDPLDLDWLWSESDALADDEPGDELSEDLAAEDEGADAAMADADLAEVAHGSTDGDGEGGMIELMAGEAIVELSQPAMARHVESIADSEVRMEAGVALVQVFDLATTPGEAASSESRLPPPAELPPADETTSAKPSDVTQRSSAVTGAMLMALPFAWRRWKQDDKSRTPSPR